MAEDDVDPKVIDDLNKRAEEQESDLPEQVDVPLNVSEDEAVRAVQQQFKDAGAECTDDEARELVRAAQEKSKRKSEEKSSEDKKSDDEKSDDEKSDDEKSDDEKSDDEKSDDDKSDE